MSLVQPAAWRGARAQRGRGGAPRGAAWPPLPRRRTDFTHFRDCGHPTVCRRGGRIRMRRPRRQTASAIRAGLLRQGAATPPPRRHSSAAPAWLPPAMSPPAAAPSRRRQHCSDSSLCCPGAAAATSVTATSAAAVSVAMAAAAARRASEELHMSVCVWRLWRFRFSGNPRYFEYQTRFVFALRSAATSP